MGEGEAGQARTEHRQLACSGGDLIADGLLLLGGIQQGGEQGLQVGGQHLLGGGGTEAGEGGPRSSHLCVQGLQAEDTEQADGGQDGSLHEAGSAFQAGDKAVNACSRPGGTTTSLLQEERLEGPVGHAACSQEGERSEGCFGWLQALSEDEDDPFGFAGFGLDNEAVFVNCRRDAAGSAASSSGALPPARYDESVHPRPAIPSRAFGTHLNLAPHAFYNRDISKTFSKKSGELAALIKEALLGNNRTSSSSGSSGCRSSGVGSHVSRHNASLQGLNFDCLELASSRRKQPYISSGSSSNNACNFHNVAPPSEFCDGGLDSDRIRSDLVDADATCLGSPILSIPSTSTPSPSSWVMGRRRNLEVSVVVAYPADPTSSLSSSCALHSSASSRPPDLGLVSLVAPSAAPSSFSPKQVAPASKSSTDESHLQHADCQSFSEGICTRGSEAMSSSSSGCVSDPYRYYLIGQAISSGAFLDAPETNCASSAEFLHTVQAVWQECEQEHECEREHVTSFGNNGSSCSGSGGGSGGLVAGTGDSGIVGSSSDDEVCVVKVVPKGSTILSPQARERVISMRQSEMIRRHGFSDQDILNASGSSVTMPSFSLGLNNSWYLNNPRKQKETQF